MVVVCVWLRHWIKVLRTYLDVDECADRCGVCHQHAVCDNTVGGFQCRCKPGFTGDGFDCQGQSVSLLKAIFH